MVILCQVSIANVAGSTGNCIVISNVPEAEQYANWYTNPELSISIVQNNVAPVGSVTLEGRLTTNNDAGVYTVLNCMLNMSGDTLFLRAVSDLLTNQECSLNDP